MAVKPRVWLDTAEHLKIAYRVMGGTPKRGLTCDFAAKPQIAEGKGFEPLRAGWVPP